MDKGSKDCRNWKGKAISWVAPHWGQCPLRGFTSQCLFHLLGARTTVPMGRFRGVPSNRRFGELPGDLCSAATHMRDTDRPVI